MNSYDVLGVRPDATHEEIKKAYRALARRTHPDVGGDAMKPLFLSVTSAWESLSDPEKRAAYDRANGIGHPVPPEPVPEPAPRPPADFHHGRPGPGEYRPAPDEPDVDDLWNAGAPTAAPKESGKRTAPPKPPRPEPGTQRSWREIFDATVQRRRRHPLPQVITALFAAWAGLLIFLGLKELILSGPEGVLPRGSGTLTYVAFWAAGTWHSCRQVGRGLPMGWGPLTAAGVGAFCAYVLNRAHLWESGVAVAAGLALSMAAAAAVRRRTNLEIAGLGPKSGKITGFNAAADTDHETRTARRMTRTALAELVEAPGSRLLENAPVKGRAVSHILINGNRVAVIDSRTLPDWVHDDLTGDLAVDASKIIPNIDTSIAADVADVRSHTRSVRGWLLIHPARSGSVELKSVRGVKVSAASPAAALEEIGQWLAEGSRAGVVDPDLAYRVMRGAAPAAR